MTDINKLAATFLQEHTWRQTKLDAIALEASRAEEARRDSRWDAETFKSAPPRFFVVFCTETLRYHVGTMRNSGSHVWSKDIARAKIYAMPCEIEDAKSIGLLLPAPWYLIPAGQGSGYYAGSSSL